MDPPPPKKAALYPRYPTSSILIYNGTTVLHFVLGAFGILLALGSDTLAGKTLAIAYFVFAFGEMYGLMPLTVCPNCVYTRLAGGLCISGMNVFSRRIARAGDVNRLADRARGILCPNNLYLIALAAPILITLIAALVHFSASLAIIAVVLVGLLLFRFFVIFPKLACLHCAAKFKCPQAAQMGVREL